MEEPDALVTVGILIERADEDEVRRLVSDFHTPDPSSPAIQVVAAVHNALREQDRVATRIVFTGNFVESVHAREDRKDRPFTMERGAGLVAAKTMPPGLDGVVDILVPLHWLQPGATDDSGQTPFWVRHVAAHEAIHATLFHIGGDPFDAHTRADFGAATTQFVVLASEQVEEHLAEYLAAASGAPSWVSTAESLSATFDAFERTLAVDLPAVPENDPDYFAKGMRITFEALHIVWKTLAYLAAAVRSDEGFAEVAADIARSKPWREWVAPWWDEYVRLLALVPMTTDVDIEATDRVVVDLAHHLQTWALGIGFDYHDANGGQDGFFRITLGS